MIDSETVIGKLRREWVTMENLFRASILLFLCVLLSACGPATQITPPPTATLAPSQTATAVIDANPTLFDPLSMPLPTVVFADGTNIPYPTHNPKIPTFLPTFDPELVSELLRSSISINRLSGPNGHVVKQITGWDYGFRELPKCQKYQWLDSKHLLLYPRTGQASMQVHDGSTAGDLATEHVVLNLTDGKLWLRPPSSVAVHEWDCESIYWSRELGLLINQQRYGSQHGPVAEAVFTYTFDGQPVAQYWGKILGVSPSGEKILVDEDTIIDLRNNKITDLAWHMNYSVGESSTLYWSPDETRLYRCCFYYADLRSGESYNFEWGELHGSDGKPLTTSMHPHQYGAWVRNGSYFLIVWDYWTIFYGDPIPMFSPAEKKYYDIASIAEIPAEVVATSSSDISPDGTYLWMKGYGEDGQYHGFLINLLDFETSSYDKAINDFEWSPDSRFAWMSIYESSKILILSADENTLKPLPAQPTSELFWHPGGHRLTYLTEDDQVLTFLDAKDMSVQNWNLPFPCYDLLWSPDGAHIALTAKDGSLWQADYPGMENVEQLTAPMAMKDLSWSPDGSAIAFISGSDMYVVETNK